MSSPTIVQVNVSQVIAPTLSTLQGTGAIISQGGTTTASGTLTPLTSASSLTSILSGAHSNTSITWTSSVATVTTASAHGFTVSDTILVTISGATPSVYNGTFLATITGTSTFTYPLVSNPGGSASPAGSYTVADVAELTSQVATFFAQGSGQAVYVLELGTGNSNDGVTALTTWINNNPSTIYIYLVPREWDNNANFITFLGNFESPGSQTYFVVTTTTSNYTAYSDLLKCVLSIVQAPSAPVAEFTAAAFFWNMLNYAKVSITNQCGPMCYKYLFGVTAYPTSGNATILAALKAAGTNVVSSAAVGGIASNMAIFGTTQDGNDWSYWFSVDYISINLVLSLSNAIINGSNSQPPLSYNQTGINTLQAVSQGVVSQAVSFNMVNTSTIPTVTAVPFFAYTRANPSAYKAGSYGGLSANCIIARGFISVVFNLQVSQFVA
jgi:hypothetical protein